MKSVWRTTIPITDEWVGTLPKFVRPLHVAPARPPALRDIAIEVRYEVDTDASDLTVMVWSEGTGHPIDHDGEYLGTVMSSGAELVWHIYWRVAS